MRCVNKASNRILNYERDSLSTITSENGDTNINLYRKIGNVVTSVEVDNPQTKSKYNLKDVLSLSGLRIDAFLDDDSNNRLLVEYNDIPNFFTFDNIDEDSEGLNIPFPVSFLGCSFNVLIDLENAANYSYTLIEDIDTDNRGSYIPVGFANPNDYALVNPGSNTLGGQSVNVSPYLADYDRRILSPSSSIYDHPLTIS